MLKRITAALFSLGVLAAASASAHAGVEVGVLTCKVDGGWGLFVGSSKKIECVFTNSNGGKHRYEGRVTKVGIDVGYTDAKVLTWAVVSLGGHKADLKGTYVGGNVEASAIIGVGANALVGGLNDNFALQPLSVQTQTGLNAALAVQSLTLR